VDTRCRQCGARVPARAAWCSLCLTPVMMQPSEPARPAAPAPGAETSGAEAADVEARATLMLAQLAADTRTEDGGSRWARRVAALPPLARFGAALALSCLLVAGLSLVAVIAGLLLG
jgi:hypothetical protein